MGLQAFSVLALHKERLKKNKNYRLTFCFVHSVSVFILFKKLETDTS